MRSPCSPMARAHRSQQARSVDAARSTKIWHGLESSQGNEELPLIYDVVIAGAGPVGLFLACELRLADLSVLVLEQAEDPSSPLKRLPFGMRGLSAPTIEAFYRRGLLNNIATPQRAKDDSGSSASTAAHWMQHLTRLGAPTAAIGPRRQGALRSRRPPLTLRTGNPWGHDDQSHATAFFVADRRSHRAELAPLPERQGTAA